MKRLIILCFIILINSNLFAKNSVIRIGGDCMLDNSVILAEVLYALDSSFIQNMYDENCKLLLFIDIDVSTGNLLSIDVTTTKKASNVPLSDSFLLKMEEYMINNNIKFYQCCSPEPGLSLDKIRISNTAHINIAIPSSSHKRLLHYMKYRKMIRESYDYYGKYS